MTVGVVVAPNTVDLDAVHRLAINHQNEALSFLDIHAVFSENVLLISEDPDKRDKFITCFAVLLPMLTPAERKDYTSKKFLRALHSCMFQPGYPLIHYVIDCLYALVSTHADRVTRVFSLASFAEALTCLPDKFHLRIFCFMQNAYKAVSHDDCGIAVDKLLNYRGSRVNEFWRCVRDIIKFTDGVFIPESVHRKMVAALHYEQPHNIILMLIIIKHLSQKGPAALFKHFPANLLYSFITSDRIANVHKRIHYQVLMMRILSAIPSAVEFPGGALGISRLMNGIRWCILNIPYIIPPLVDIYTKFIHMAHTFQTEESDEMIICLFGILGHPSSSPFQYNILNAYLQYPRTYEKTICKFVHLQIITSLCDVRCHIQPEEKTKLLTLREPYENIAKNVDWVSGEFTIDTLLQSPIHFFTREGVHVISKHRNDLATAEQHRVQDVYSQIMYVTAKSYKIQLMISSLIKKVTVTVVYNEKITKNVEVLSWWSLRFFEYVINIRFFGRGPTIESIIGRDVTEQLVRFCSEPDNENRDTYIPSTAYLSNTHYVIHGWNIMFSHSSQPIPIDKEMSYFDAYGNTECKTFIIKGGRNNIPTPGESVIVYRKTGSAPVPQNDMLALNGTSRVFDYLLYDQLPITCPRFSISVDSALMRCGVLLRRADSLFNLIIHKKKWFPVRHRLFAYKMMHFPPCKRIRCWFDEYTDPDMHLPYDQPDDFLRISLARPQILEDGKLIFNLLARGVHTFKVIFKNEYAVGRGVTREFYTLFATAFAVDIFKPTESDCGFIPRADTPLTDIWTLGLFLARVILDEATVYFPISKHFFALMRREFNSDTASDILRDVDPELYRSLVHAPSGSLYDMQFVFPATNCPLTPGGELRHVRANDSEDEHNYIELVTSYGFGTAYRRRFMQTFVDAFNTVLNFNELADALTDEEIAGLYTSTAVEFPLMEVRQHVVVPSWIDANTEINFKIALSELDIQECEQFLVFVTGMRRLPPGGMAKLNPLIKLDILQIPAGANPDDYYPMAYTCSHLIRMPIYSTIDIMKMRLKEAISQEPVFGLG
jgi:hypothetical protein